MKTTILIALFLCSVAFSFSQNGTITSKELQPKPGVENMYVYQPQADIIIPEKATATIVYLSKKQYYNKNIPLVKNSDGYDFSFKAPDSTEVLIIGITDKDKNIVDNNKEAGFITFLYNQKGERFPAAGVTSATLLGGFAPYILKLSIPPASLIKQYQHEYKLHPQLVNEPEYFNYAYLLYSVKKDTVKPQLEAYAKQMMAAKKDEAKWMTGVDIYRMLKMAEPLKKAEAVTLAAYPNGKLAKQKFWDAYYADKQSNENKKLDMMKEYISRFNDSSDDIKDGFYSNIIYSLMQKKDWNAINKYEPLISNKMQVAGMYNNAAWELTGEGLTKAGGDLDYAKMVSKRSVDIVAERMNTPKDDDEKEMLSNSLDMFADTYALILYKLQQYDSAFYYQDAIFKRGAMGPDGVERYAAYAEKVKGALFTKQLIEPELLSGVTSPVMLNQLHSLYKQLNLPEEEYNKIAEKTSQLAMEKMVAIVKAKYGSEAAKDFTLKDLKGNAVTLSSLKNKVVVLDFWATWCGPCRASFPEMQEAVTKYKDDNGVVFLFIDAFERMEPKEMLTKTSKFINDNKYSFQVLLDTKDEVANNYKIESIPSKFVLNKQGNIVFMGNSINDIASVIESAKK